MRNTTLEVEKEELQKTIRGLYRQRFLSVIFGLVGVLIILAATFPDKTEALLSDKTFLSHAACVIFTMIVVRMIRF